MVRLPRQITASIDLPPLKIPQRRCGGPPHVCPHPNRTPRPTDRFGTAGCWAPPRLRAPPTASPTTTTAKGLPPPCDIPSGCCFFTGPWTRSSLRMLRRVAAFCRPLRPVLLLVSFPRQRRPAVGVLGLCWLLRGWFDCFCCPHTSVLRPSVACLAAFPCVWAPGALLLHALSQPSTTYAPPLRGSRVRRARSLLVAGSARFMVDAADPPPQSAPMPPNPEGAAAAKASPPKEEHAPLGGPGIGVGSTTDGSRLGHTPSRPTTAINAPNDQRRWLESMDRTVTPPWPHTRARTHTMSATRTTHEAARARTACGPTRPTY